MAEQRLVHLLPHEVRIWRKFASQPPFPLDQVTFDLHLGRGIPVDPNWTPSVQRMATTLTQKRVDAVVVTGSDVWILELKRRVGLGALGQLLGYAVLYMDEFGSDPVPRLGVVAEAMMSDVDDVLAEYGISVFLV